MAAGRPRFIKTPEDFDSRAEAYFADCAERNKPLTVTGLAIGIGLSTRQSLEEYAARPEFADSVKRARSRVEDAYEQRLHGNSPTGAIFALKNMGWSDRQELDVSGSLQVVSQAQRDAAVKAANSD